MTVDLVSVNLALDAVIKLLVLVAMLLVIVVLRDLDRAVKAANHSAESLADALDRAGGILSAKKMWNKVRGKDE